MDIVLLVACIVGGVVVLLIVAWLLYRAARKARSARALAIRTPNKVVEEQYIAIGGCPQWIQIRGERRDNPVLLVLHGGPGIAFSGFAHKFQNWERDFTVVQWDQPGAGKTASAWRGRSAEPLSIENMVRDGLEISEWVLSHLGQRKLILFATSWGTILGTRMVRQRPDLYWAYVGAGQVVNTARADLLAYELAEERARHLGDVTSLGTLRDVGPPPYADPRRNERERKTLAKVGVDTFPELSDMLAAAFYSPGYSLKDGVSLLGGMRSSLVQLLGPIQAYDAWQAGATFGLPMFFLQGALDFYTPAQAVQEFYAAVDAPQKALVLWPEEGHFPYFSHPDVVLKELLARVRPLAQPS